MKLQKTSIILILLMCDSLGSKRNTDSSRQQQSNSIQNNILQQDENIISSINIEVEDYRNEQFKVSMRQNQPKYTNFFEKTIICISQNDILGYLLSPKFCINISIIAIFFCFCYSIFLFNEVNQNQIKINGLTSSTNKFIAEIDEIYGIFMEICLYKSLLGQKIDCFSFKSPDQP